MVQYQATFQIHATFEKKFSQACDTWFWSKAIISVIGCLQNIQIVI